jgi:predicted transcriptional regulator
MEAAPDVVEEKMSDNIKKYIETLSGTESDKPIITDNGKIILDYMQKTDMPMMKAKDIGDGLMISSRKVSGSLRKLVTDGFVEKVGQDPVIYALTEKGKNFKID